MIKKAVTHLGTHHTDECLALETIKHFVTKDFIIERTFKVTPEMFNDPSTWVLDIGGRLDFFLNNLDHHQSRNIVSTNRLVLEKVCKDKELVLQLRYLLFDYVDAVDRGHIVEKGLPEYLADLTICQIVRNTNHLTDGFELALEVCAIALKAAIAAAKTKPVVNGGVVPTLETLLFYLDEKSPQADNDLCISSLIRIARWGLKAAAKAAKEAEKQWAEVKKNNGVAFYDSPKFLQNWQELAERDGVMLLVTPNARGGYQIMSRDSTILTIPQNESQTFRHANGFLAVYQSKEEALKHASEIM